MNYYLLAYPRSGSSLTRVLISAITGMQPMQPDSTCELNKICGIYVTKQNNKFFKFHYPVDAGIHIPDNPKNTLILLIRSPVENIPSFLFSDRHKNSGVNKTIFNKEYYIQYFKKTPQEVWNNYIAIYQRNINFYQKWQNKKLFLSYEKIITDPTNLLTDLDDLPHSDESIDFNKIFNQVLKLKSDTSDIYKINTAGKNLNFFEPLLPNTIRQILKDITVPKG